MKRYVYVAISSMDYEGYSSPEGVYSTLAKARKHRFTDGDDFHIFRARIDGEHRVIEVSLHDATTKKKRKGIKK